MDFLHAFSSYFRSFVCSVGQSRRRRWADLGIADAGYGSGQGVPSVILNKMNPYAKPNERKVGTRRPKISHLPRHVDTRTHRQRLEEKEAVAAERRAIKKSARRHLKQQLRDELLDA
jgi:hypothetical protein